jgi:hypothetical protein
MSIHAVVQVASGERLAGLKPACMCGALRGPLGFAQGRLLKAPLFHGGAGDRG